MGEGGFGDGENRYLTTGLLILDHPSSPEQLAPNPPRSAHSPTHARSTLPLSQTKLLPERVEGVVRELSQ